MDNTTISLIKHWTDRRGHTDSHASQVSATKKIIHTHHNTAVFLPLIHSEPCTCTFNLFHIHPSIHDGCMDDPSIHACMMGYVGSVYALESPPSGMFPKLPPKIHAAKNHEHFGCILFIPDINLPRLPVVWHAA